MEIKSSDAEKIDRMYYKLNKTFAEISRETGVHISTVRDYIHELKSFKIIDEETDGK